MIFAIVFSVILFICGIIFFITDTGQMMPLGVRLIPLINIGILWIYTVFFALKGKMGIIGVILLVLFWIINAIIVFPATCGSILFSILDREKKLAPQVIGKQESQSEICIIFHPGLSEFTTLIVKDLGQSLAESGYKVTLYSAHSELKINLRDYKAVGFSSPLYAGQIRPPLRKFIDRNDLTGVNCFIVLTGADDHGIERDVQNASKLIQKKGGKILTGTKFIVKDVKKINVPQKEIEDFSKLLKSKL